MGTVLGVENVKKNVKFDAVAKEQNGRFQATGVPCSIGIIPLTMQRLLLIQGIGMIFLLTHSYFCGRIHLEKLFHKIYADSAKVLTGVQMNSAGKKNQNCNTIVQMNLLSAIILRSYQYYYCS